jgi:hypothetical protein
MALRCVPDRAVLIACIPAALAVTEEAIRIAAKVIAHRARPNRYLRQVRLVGVSQ